MTSEHDHQEEINELQMIDHNLQSLSLQKQAFDFELSESEHALQELSNARGDVFKIVGQVMVKSDKNSLREELEKKVKLMNLRIKAINSQEKELSDRAEELRSHLVKKKSSK